MIRTLKYVGLRPLILLVVISAIMPLSRTIAIEFVPGHFYASASSSNGIWEYDSLGNVLGVVAVTYPGEFRGIAFGPDGLLYASVAMDARIDGFDVVAIDSDGVVKQSYHYSGASIASNISYGKIAFDHRGHFYVNTVRFDIGFPSSGNNVLSHGAFDVEPLSNGHLFALDGHGLFELDESGATIRQVAGGSDCRGMAYDPTTGSVYISMLSYGILKIDAATNTLLDIETYSYADDLVLTRDGRLVAGSRVQSPGIFSKDLELIGTFQGSERLFVTEFVPEPPTWLLAMLGIVAIVCAATRRRAGMIKARVAIAAHQLSAGT